MAFIAAASIAAGAGILGGVGGAIISSNATKDAAEMQAAAANHATDVQQSAFNTIQQNQKPWLDAGAAALPQLSSMAANAPSFTAQDFKNNMDPGYQFNLQQGLDAIQRSAAARGGLQNGGTLKALSGYAQGQASNEYQNAYSRFMNNQNTQFNRLSSIAGLGQTANGQLAQSGMENAGALGSIGMSGANAQGAASIAGGQMWGNTLSSLGGQIGNNAMSASMMNRLFPQGGAGMGSMGGIGSTNLSGGFSMPNSSGLFSGGTE
jgi:hypothetical protein